MKNLENTITSPIKYFTVTEKDINNKKALLTNVLYTEIENFVKDVISKHSYIAYPIPQLYKLQVLNNAFLNDKLHIKSKILKFNSSDLQLAATVVSNSSTKENIICKAVFKFPLKTVISVAS